MDRPQKTLTRGRTLLYGAGGAAIAAVACALVAREDILPLQLANGLVAAVGGTAAVIAESPIAQAIGQGAALAAGAQLGLSYIDHHYQENPPKLPTVVAAKGTAKGDGKRQSESLSPGALEAAYERARRRMSMAEAASQMAA
jgi:shikimate 5-dehydrogenase